MGAGQAVALGVLLAIILLITVVAPRRRKRNKLREARSRRRHQRAVPTPRSKPLPPAAALKLTFVDTDDLAETPAEQARAQHQPKERFMKFDQGRGLRRAKNRFPWKAGRSLGYTGGGDYGSGGDTSCGDGGGDGGGSD